jgi:hypothetical protein
MDQEVELREFVSARGAALSRLALPDAAYAVPSGQIVASVVADHFPNWREVDHGGQLIPPREPGYASTSGRLAPFTIWVDVRPASEAPACGNHKLLSCVERRVYGADDPATVYVGAWDDDDWADCCPRNTRAAQRSVVYVGPRLTVVVYQGRLVPDGEPTIGTELDQRLIDLALDPRLQEAGDQ